MSFTPGSMAPLELVITYGLLQTSGAEGAALSPFGCAALAFGAAPVDAPPVGAWARALLEARPMQINPASAARANHQRVRIPLSLGVISFFPPEVGPRA